MRSRAIAVLFVLAGAAAAGAACSSAETPTASFGHPITVGHLTLTPSAPYGRANDSGARVDVDVAIAVDASAPADVDIAAPSLHCDAGSTPPLDEDGSNHQVSVSPGGDDTATFEWIVEDGPCSAGTITMAGTELHFDSLVDG
jgi:hypothetical protein